MSSSYEKHAARISCSYVGDDPIQGHHVRDNPRMKAGEPQENFDVVIVGGGISGLTAAYELKDHNILLLEKDQVPGGAARRKEWNGIRYTLGATNIRLGYEVELDGRKFDFLSSYFDELGLKWSKIREPTDNYFIEGRRVRDILGEGVKELPYPPETQAKFKEAWDYLRTLVDSDDCPVIPVEANNQAALAQDQFSFEDLLKKFGLEVKKTADLLSRSIFGENSDQVSAFAALCYLKGEFGDQYAAPGGTAQITEQLLSFLGDRVRSGRIATGIEQNDEAAYVTYLDDEFKPVTVSCKAVIYAASKHVAPRIFRDLLPEKVRAIRKMRFDAYFLANLFCEDIVYKDSFAAYFESGIFTDIVVNDWIAGNQGVGGRQVLSLFCPRGVEGRDELLSQSCHYWVGQILQDLERYGFDTERIAGVEICRYGHHFAIPYPGFTTSVREIVAKPQGRYFFAKDDTQGVPALESAIWSGMRAAKEVERKLSDNLDTKADAQYL